MAKKSKVVLSKPKRLRVKKKAKEMTRLGSALRSLGGLGGGALGSLVGMPGSGSSFGTGIGAALSRWLGAGDYTVQMNSLVHSLKSSSSIPMMHSTGQSITVRHKEFITDITAGTGTPTTFNVSQSYALNPGLSTSFPWLSTVAQNFQEYTWKGLVYHYIPTSGSSVASTNTALGSVMMATNYRATAPAYTSKQFMLNEYFSSDSRPSETFCHPIECDPKENPYNVQYIRSSSVPSGEDQKTYDLGVVSVATVGVPAAGTNLGELWATYEVELRKPIAVGMLATDSGWQETARTGAATSTAIFGTTTASSGGSLLTSIAPTILTFNKGLTGAFLIILSYSASGATAWAPITFSASNCTVTDNFGLYGSTVTSASGANNYFVGVSIPDSSVAATLTSTTNFVTGTVNNMSILCYQINSSSI